MTFIHEPSEINHSKKIEKFSFEKPYNKGVSEHPYWDGEELFQIIRSYGLQNIMDIPLYDGTYFKLRGGGTGGYVSRSKNEPE